MQSRLWGRRAAARLAPHIPEGDILIPVARLLERLRSAVHSYLAPAWNEWVERTTTRLERYQARLGSLRAATAELEVRLQYWIVAATLFLSLVLILLALVALT